MTLVASLIVAAIGAVMGTLVAWVLVRDEFPRQAVRQRADRPAVRAADDRRRADPDRAVRPGQPGRHPPRLHARRGDRRAAVRDAAVRRALGAAGADRARPRGRGGGGLARRLERARRSGGSSCPRCGRRSSRARRSRSPARSARSARSLLIAGKVQIASIVIFADIESDAPQAAAALSVVLIAAGADRAVRPAPARRPRCALAAAPSCRCGASRCSTCRAAAAAARRGVLPDLRARLRRRPGAG